MSKILDKISWPIVIIFCLTLGLAPFRPPHIWEKLNMLVAGTLVQTMDILDLLMHGIPWIFLLLKLGVTLLERKKPT